MNVTNKDDETKLNTRQELPFEVVTVKRSGLLMKGVVATSCIPGNSYLCSYGGDPVPNVGRSSFLNGLTQKLANHHSRYDMSHPADEYTIVPVDDTGELKDKYKNEPCFYFNEASEKNEFPNVRFANNFFFESIDLITLRDIEPGEELVVFYGHAYGKRPYPMWWLSNTHDNREKSQYESALVLDMVPMTRDSCPVTVLNRFRDLGGQEKKQQLLSTLDRKLVHLWPDKSFFCKQMEERDSSSSSSTTQPQQQQEPTQKRKHKQTTACHNNRHVKKSKKAAQ